MAISAYLRYVCALPARELTRVTNKSCESFNWWTNRAGHPTCRLKSSYVSHLKIVVASTIDQVAWGGSEELWALMAREALQRNDEVFVSTRRTPSIPGPLAELGQMGARFQFRGPRVPQGTIGTLRRLLATRFRIKRLNRFRTIPDISADVVLVNCGAGYDVLTDPELMSFLDALTSPYVLLVQYMDDHLVSLTPAKRQIAARVFSRAKRLVFIAEQNLRTVERQLARHFPNAVVLQNPVALADASVVPWPENSTAQFANVARLNVRAKGHDLLFEVLGGQAWKERKWKLNLYGDGPDRPYLRELSRHYGIETDVVFHGHVTNVRQIWESNQLLLMPSRGEGTPLAMLEAMVCGRGALVTDVGGMTEWISDDKNGIVAEAPTYLSLGRALERAWHKRDDWQRFGEEARTAVMRKLDPHPGRRLLDVLYE